MSTFAHVTRAGVSVLIDIRDSALPRVLHWGASLGPISQDDAAAIADAVARQTPPATLDAAASLTVFPLEGDGWSGRPGMELRQGGVQLRTRWVVQHTTIEEASLRVEARDEASGLCVRIRLSVAEGGVVWVDATLRHNGSVDAEPIEVEWMEPTMPVSSSTTHVTMLDGRWSREKRAATTEIPSGATVRQSRRGRPGHDAPTILVVSEGLPRWSEGRVWATHVAWSADTSYRLDRMTEAVNLIGSGELLRPGELVLSPGDEYVAPATAFVFSDSGLDGVAARFHTWLRSRPEHPRSPRPLTLNTWEAVYFDHHPDQVEPLAELAASIGVERFVLDDGWFQGRRDDTTSLGDWSVDRSVWPHGLRPLSDRVHHLGMQFGLWFEPEMISLDSDLARRHPDWLLHDHRHLEHDVSLSWRSQFVLDLANPSASAHILERMDALITEIGIDYIKWDHNRDLIEPVHAGRPGTHAQTVAIYDLMRELKRRHPGLEIESCSSGGARTDLGILAFCDRVWASDSNDPVERQDIQRWTGLLLPPELVGAHVGPTTSHSSGRSTALGFRLATSLMGSAGIEWNILTCSLDEIASLKKFAALYKELRPLLHSATVHHPPLRDPAWRATAFIGSDAAEAVLIIATVAGLEDARAERIRMPGLDPDRRYRVTVRREIGETNAGWTSPPWLSAGSTELPGSALAHVGLQLPSLWPMQAMVLHVVGI